MKPPSWPPGQAPGALNPYGPNRERLLSRQRWVLSRMAQLGYLSPQNSRRAVQPRMAPRAAVPAPRRFPLKPRILSTWFWPKRDRRPRVLNGSADHPGSAAPATGAGHRKLAPAPAPEGRRLPGGRGDCCQRFPGSHSPGGLLRLWPPGPGVQQRRRCLALAGFDP